MLTQKRIVFFVKKSNYKKASAKQFSLLLLSSFLVLLSSCKFDDVSGNTEPKTPTPNPPADTVGTVQPDGILEAVTWNLEWFGTGASDPDNNGPGNEILQRNNALQVIDSLHADLYAFEEVNSKRWLDSLTTYMKGYEGFTADHITYNQKTAFVYNTQTIEPVAMGAIKEFQDDNDWAGRLPLYFRFNYTYPEQSITIPVYAIVIHGKCCPDQDAYQRRKRAAQSLYNYLTRNEPETNIILLGDYNDDVDESIHEGAETPYAPFVNDTNNFTVVTQSLSQQGVSSTLGFDDMIDHITVSNEMAGYYQLNSVKVFTEVAQFIESYGSTTSDHYPVIATFDLR